MRNLDLVDRQDDASGDVVPTPAAIPWFARPRFVSLMIGVVFLAALIIGRILWPR